MVPGNNTMPNGIEMKNMKSSKLSFGKASNGTGGKNPPNKNQVVPVIDIEVWISVYVFTGHINATRKHDWLRTKVLLLYLLLCPYCLNTDGSE